MFDMIIENHKFPGGRNLHDMVANALSCDNVLSQLKL